MSRMPMFPLEQVLFPYTPLALRLFEERYLMMLGHLLDAEDPTFGVALIERGSEVGGGDQRFALATVAEVTEVTPHAEHMTVLARGGQRVEVISWHDDAPYPVADVRPLPDLEWKDALAPLLDEAEAIVRRVLVRAAEFGPTRWPADVELSDDPLARAWQVAAIAPVGPLDQLRLLRATTLGGLLRQTIDLTIEADALLGGRMPPATDGPLS